MKYLITVEFEAMNDETAELMYKEIIRDFRTQDTAIPIVRTKTNWITLQRDTGMRTEPMRMNTDF